MIVWMSGEKQIECWDFVIANKGAILKSYYYIVPVQNPEYYMITERKKTNHEIKIFLDSGAFSAFSKGVEINIHEYIDFIKENKQYLEVYANLDVIGDPEATLNNQQIMEDAGLHPMPCFHLKEDFDYLDYYIENYDYIALGGTAMAKGNRPALISWMDECWDKICDQPSRMPKVKVHGFAVTSVTLMFRYPWYSVDSTSWVVAGRNGSIYVPRSQGDKYNYLVDSFKVAVSERSPNKKDADAHITTFPVPERDKILEYIHMKGYVLGKSEFHKEDRKTYQLQDNERWMDDEVETIIEDGLSNNYKQRDEINILYFLDLEKAFPKWPWPYKPKITNKGFDV